MDVLGGAMLIYVGIWHLNVNNFSDPRASLGGWIFAMVILVGASVLWRGIVGCSSRTVSGLLVLAGLALGLGIVRVPWIC